MDVSRDVPAPPNRAINQVSRPTDAATAILASKQDGVVKRAQLLEAGVGTGAVKRRARNGRLHRIHRGVYLVGHTALAPRARETAALLACGAGAVISHRTAAHVWGILPGEDSEIDVTVVGRRCRPKDGIRIHLAASLDRRDRRSRNGIPLTAPARTLIDCAAEADDDAELERAVSEARVLRLVSDREIEAALARAGKRAGVARMRRLLGAENERGFTRREAERRMRRLLSDGGLPQPLCNARVNGFEVDFVWPEQRLIIEVDGYQFHGHRRAFERDRRKDQALIAAGYRVMRVTWRQLRWEPLRVAVAIAGALAVGGGAFAAAASRPALGVQTAAAANRNHG